MRRWWCGMSCREFVCRNCKSVYEGVVEVRKTKPLGEPDLDAHSYEGFICHTYWVAVRRYLADQWDRSSVCPVCNHENCFIKEG